MKKPEEVEGSNIMDEMLNDFRNRPFYDRWIIKLCFKFYMFKSHALYFFGRLPINTKVYNDMAWTIKDDIEFGYDLEMIYGKIMYGSYGNKKIPEDYDWFLKNNIDWKSWKKDGYIFSKKDMSEAIKKTIKYLNSNTEFNEETEEKFINDIIQQIKNGR